MALVPQMFATLGACTNKIINTPQCIAKLYNKKHFSNLVANHQIATLTLFPLASVGQKKPLDMWHKQCQSEKWKARNGVGPEFQSPSSPEKKAVGDFYQAFQERDIEKLKQLVLSECVIQDFLFYTPFQGKENVINFWQNAMDAMGPNIHIFVDDVIEDNDHMATVFWHLAWKEKKIPFSKGCSFFKFKEVDGRLFISEKTGLEELPLKPGELILKLLKAISTLLDSYDPLAAVLLDSHVFQDDTTLGGKS